MLPYKCNTKKYIIIMCLSFPVKLQGVLALPTCFPRSTNCLWETMSFSKATGLAASWCLSTQFSVFVYCIADPVDFCISTNSLKIINDLVIKEKNQFTIHLKCILFNYNTMQGKCKLIDYFFLLTGCAVSTVITS